MTEKEENKKTIIVIHCSNVGCLNTFTAYLEDKPKDIRAKAWRHGWFHYRIGYRETRFICPNCMRRKE